MPDNRPERWGAPAAAASHTERLLLDGVERLLRHASSEGWVLLALHLSALPPGTLRAHHGRIAGAVLETAAARAEGGLFTLAGGDIAMLFRPVDGGATVSALLAKLFGAEQPDIDALRTLWPLPFAAVPALAYIRGRVHAASLPRPEEPIASARSTAIVQALARTAPIADITQRQTGVLLRPGHKQALLPIYREVSIAAARLEQRIAAAGQAQADPFLFAHLCGQLDRRLLAALAEDSWADSPLSGGLQGAALHINLTVHGILSEGFASLAKRLAKEPDAPRIAIELPFVEAFAEPKSFLLARERLRLAGMDLVLDGTTHLALAATSLMALEPAMIKLNWSTALPKAGQELRSALARIGPEKLVLHRSGAEGAVAWGLAHGIHRFQGHHIDAMLAAERVRSCPAGMGRCTMRQCADRAAATSLAGRVGCLAQRLLDAATPRAVA